MSWRGELLRARVFHNTPALHYSAFRCSVAELRPPRFDLSALLVGFFYHVPSRCGRCGAAHLASENWGRGGRHQFVLFQNKFGIKAVACRFVDSLSTKVAEEPVFVIVVLPE